MPRVVFSPNSNLMTANYRSAPDSVFDKKGCAQLWDLGAGEMLFDMVKPKSPRSFVAVTFSSDSRAPATLGSDATVEKWDISTRRVAGSRRRVPRAGWAVLAQLRHDGLCRQDPESAPVTSVLLASGH